MISKKPIPFTKMRWIFLCVSLVFIIAGWGTLFVKGFNLGIDFTGGLDKQFQIAPVAFTVKYTGNEEVQVNINSRMLTVDYPQRDEDPKRFILADYKTIQDLVTDLKQIENLNIEVKEAALAAPATNLLALSFPVLVDRETLIANYFSPEGGVVASIDDVRKALEPLGKYSLQYVGAPERQEYLIKVQVAQNVNQTDVAATDVEDSDFLVQKDKQITDLLADKFGKDSVMMKKTDYIGASFSVQLVRDAINAVLLTLVLILIYVAFRFKFVYGVGAIIATLHDVLFMIGVIAFFQLEVNSAVLAAILTIIGYSLNDTIVVFDRMRENFSLMPNTPRDVVINTSITQSLSRTIITSVTTQLAIICVFIFATGAIKEFALNLLVGVVVGTYSSIFIAAPAVFTGLNIMDKRKRVKELGPQAAQAKPVKKTEKLAEEVEAVANAAALGTAPGKVEVVREQMSRKQTRKKKK